jgi:hypothetical protein
VNKGFVLSESRKNDFYDESASSFVAWLNIGRATVEEDEVFQSSNIVLTMLDSKPSVSIAFPSSSDARSVSDLIISIVGELRMMQRYATAAIEIDGKIVDNVPETPLIIDGRVYARVCSVSKELGVRMMTFKSESVWIDREYEHFELPVGERRLVFRGKEEQTPVAPLIVGNAVYFPLRYVAERLGFRVDWNSTRRTVVITKPRSMR